MTADQAHEGAANGLREGGERLAAAAEALKADNSPAKISEFLNALRAHVSAFMQIGQPREAMGTAVMGLLTAFGFRFRPEEHAVQYLELLLFLAVSGAMVLQETTDPFDREHLEAIDAELGPLALASYEHLDGKNILPPNLRGPYSALPQWINPDTEFQGHKITAMMAPDILYDIAARLTAMGIIE